MKISNPCGLNNSPLITIDILKKQLDELSAAFTNILVGDELSATLSEYGYVPLNNNHKIDEKYYDNYSTGASFKLKNYEFSTSGMTAISGYIDEYSKNAYITLNQEIPGFVLKVEDKADSKTILTECDYTDSGNTVLYITLQSDSPSAIQPLSSYTFTAFSLLNADGSPLIIPSAEIIN